MTSNAQRGFGARSAPLLIATVLTLLIAVALTPVMSAAQDRSATRQSHAISLWRVSVDSDVDVDYLVNSEYDLMEWRGTDYLVVLGERSVAAELQAEGFAVQLERELLPLPPLGGESLTPTWLDPQPGFSSTEREVIELQAYYGGYRTVEEHYEFLNQTAAAYPGLAQVYDYGDSWLKESGLANGNELMAICITEIQPGDCALDPVDAKPRAVIMAAIHSRELQTSEMAWRLIDELTSKFGVDADITQMLMTTEVWIIPVANPDGRQIVESGGNQPYMQRKNANDTVGQCTRPPTSTNHHGVDLNRNADFGWGGDGTSSNPCAQTWPGDAPASEPEQEALQDLFAGLWADNKGAPAEPAPETTTGTFITVHSSGELILIPNGTDGGQTPNHDGMTAWAFRMSHYNDYVTGPADQVLYAATGTTDDYVYYTLGVPGVTYELSPTSGSCGGFAPIFGCMDDLWELNRDALLYSIKVAGAPYLQSQGPSVTTVNAVRSGATVQLSAVADDTTLGDRNGSIGRPGATDIAAARYFIDVGPLQGGSPVAMVSADAGFDEPTESATAEVSALGLGPGDHLLMVQARNDAGFWGPVTTASFVVPVPGDMNGDGSRDASDVQVILDYLAGHAEVVEVVDPLLADMNTDGQVTLLDALILAQSL